MTKKKVQVDIKYNVNGVDDAVESFEEIGKASDKSAKKVEGLGDGIGDLNGGLGGMIGTIQNTTKALMALIATPAGAVIAAIAIAVGLVAKALQNNEELMNKFKVGLAFLGGLLKPLEKLFGKVFEAIVFAIEKPGEAWDNIVETFDKGVKFLDKVVWKPFKAQFTIVGGAVEAQILKMRIAWNKLTGDAEEAQKLTKELKNVQNEMVAANKVIQDGNKAAKQAFDDAVGSVKKFVNDSIAAGKATAELEEREQSLLKLRRQVEVQNAKALAQLEALKLIRDDESKSFEERKKANKEIAQVEANRINQLLSLGQKELQLEKDKARILGASTERLDAIKEKEIELADFRSQSSGIRTEQVTNENALNREQFQLAAALIDKQFELDTKLIESAIEVADAKVKAEEAKLAKLKELGIQEKALIEEQEFEVKNAKLEAEKLRKEELEDINTTNEEKLVLEKQLQKRLIQARESSADKDKELRQLAFNDEIAQLIKNKQYSAEVEKQLQEELNRDLAKIDKDWADKAKADADKIDKEKLESKKELENAIFVAAEEGLRLSDSLSNIKLQNLDKESEAIKAKVDAGLLTEEEGSKKLQEIELKKAKTQRNAALRQVALDQAKAISGLVGASLSKGLLGAAELAAGLAIIGANFANVYSILNAPLPQISGSASAPSPNVNNGRQVEGVSAGAERFGAQLPIKAYVTEAEITQSQKNINNIQNLSELG